jgi:hypothetical protein
MVVRVFMIVVVRMVMIFMGMIVRMVMIVVRMAVIVFMMVMFVVRLLRVNVGHKFTFLLYR